MVVKWYESKHSFLTTLRPRIAPPVCQRL